jgi:hypothetical protein
MQRTPVFGELSHVSRDASVGAAYLGRHESQKKAAENIRRDSELKEQTCVDAANAGRKQTQKLLAESVASVRKHLETCQHVAAHQKKWEALQKFKSELHRLFKQMKEQNTLRK